MAARDDGMRTMCCAAISTLLVADVDCGVSKEAVQLVADLVRKRSCACHADVVRVLAVLTFSQVTRAEPEEGKKGKKKVRCLSLLLHSVQFVLQSRGRSRRRAASEARRRYGGFASGCLCCWGGGSFSQVTRAEPEERRARRRRGACFRLSALVDNTHSCLPAQW
jgi:hypothetical protein